MTRLTRRPIAIEERNDLDGRDPFDRVVLDLMLEVCKPIPDHPGVLADTIDNGAWVTVRGVMSDPDHPTPDAVSRYLDSLPRDRRVIVYAVTSRTLAEMLARRGFECVVRWDDTLKIWDEGAMVREPEAS